MKVNPKGNFKMFLESLRLIVKQYIILTNAVFRLERATETLELTYLGVLGKYFACVNAN